MLHALLRRYFCFSPAFYQQSEREIVDEINSTNRICHDDAQVLFFSWTITLEIVPSTGGKHVRIRLAVVAGSTAILAINSLWYMRAYPNRFNVDR